MNGYIFQRVTRLLRDAISLPVALPTATLEPPRLAERFGTVTIGFTVADELVLCEVVFQRAIEAERDVCRVTGNVRVARRIGISFGLAACLHAVQEIANVVCRR